MMLARAQSLAGQFIFDVQTHFVRDDFKHAGTARLAQSPASTGIENVGRGVTSLARTNSRTSQGGFYYDSDTNLALLSGAPFDDPSWWLLSNEQIVAARAMINDFAGSRRLLAHR